MRSNARTRRGALLLLAAALLFVPGCSRTPEGPKRNPLYGRITVRGKPVRGGRIVFSPDTKQGNSGPGAFAFIRDGHYETPKGHVVVQGPHQIDILGYDQEVDLSTDAEPKATVRTTIGFNIPADGGEHDFLL